MLQHFHSWQDLFITLKESVGRIVQLFLDIFGSAGTKFYRTHHTFHISASILKGLDNYHFFSIMTITFDLDLNLFPFKRCSKQ